MKRYKFRVNKATIVYVDAEDVITAKQIVMDSGYRKAELVTITKVIP